MPEVVRLAKVLDNVRPDADCRNAEIDWLEECLDGTRVRVTLHQMAAAAQEWTQLAAECLLHNNKINKFSSDQMAIND